MNIKLLLIGLAMSGLLLQTNALLGAQGEKGAASITLDSKQGRVTFPHGRHQAIFVDCRPCHQLFPTMPLVIGKMMAAGTLKPKEVMNMCKKCHELRAAKGDKAGPLACKGCHAK